jgi:hypothetical protein
MMSHDAEFADAGGYGRSAPVERIHALEQTVSVYGELIDVLRHKVYALEHGTRYERERDHDDDYDEDES